MRKEMIVLPNERKDEMRMCEENQTADYLSFSLDPKLGSTAVFPTPFPEPQNSSFLHLINTWETISVRISKMIYLQKAGLRCGQC